VVPDAELWYARVIMKAVIVLPTYNESENLERLIREIQRVEPNLDILVIDDSSPDGTGEIADRLATESMHLQVIHRPAKSGRGSATARGFQYAIENGYDFVLEIDVDFSHPPSDIPKLLEAAPGADLVIASRFIKGGGVEGWNWTRKAIHFAADLSVKVILGTPNTDHTNGFRCYRVEKLKTIAFDKLVGMGYVGQTLLENIFHRLGYTIEEVPTIFKDREHGVSKMGKGEMVNGLKNMIKLRGNCMKHGISYYTK